MVRDAVTRKRRYDAGLQPDVIGKRFDEVAPVMRELEAEYFGQIADMEAKVKQACEAVGVPGFLVGQYVNVGRECYSLAKRFTQATRDAEAQRVVDKWAARGLDGELLRLACVAGGCHPEAPPTPPTVINLDDLADVEIVDPETCHVLHYDAADQKWKNAPGLGAGVVGKWETPLLTRSAYTIVSNLPHNTLRAHLICVQRRKRYDCIGIFLAGAGGAGARARLGVYGVDANYYPSNLLLDAGEVDCTGVGARIIVIDLTLNRGIYALAMNTNDTTIDFRYHDSFLVLTGETTLFSTAGNAWNFTYAYGPLPNPFPGGATEDNRGYIKLRVAELL